MDPQTTLTIKIKLQGKRLLKLSMSRFSICLIIKQIENLRLIILTAFYLEVLFLLFIGEMYIPVTKFKFFTST